MLLFNVFAWKTAFPICVPLSSAFQFFCSFAEFVWWVNVCRCCFIFLHQMSVIEKKRKCGTMWNFDSKKHSFELNELYMSHIVYEITCINNRNSILYSVNWLTYGIDFEHSTSKFIDDSKWRKVLFVDIIIRTILI